MRPYESPDIRLMIFEAADVITTSETEPIENEENMTDKG